MGKTERLLSDQEWFQNDMTHMALVNPDLASEKITELKDALYKELMNKPMMSGDDILHLPCEPNDYLVENMLWRDDVALILAREKVGKTFWTQQMCYAMTCGEPFMGQFDIVKPLKVLYIQAEGSMSGTKERIATSIKSEGINWNPKNWRHIFVPSIELDTEEGYEHIMERLESEPDFIPDVVVIDPVYQSMGGDLSDNKAARKYISYLRKIMGKLHCAILLVHHEHRGKKNQQGDDLEEGDNAIMGSFAFKAFVSHVFRLTWNKKNGTLRKMACDTQRNGDVVEKLDMDLIKPDGVFRIPNCEVGTATERSVYLNIKHNGRACADMVKEQTGMGISTVRKCFANLIAKGKIEKSTKKDGRKVLYKVRS